jgi:hypothetical protein
MKGPVIDKGDARLYSSAQSGPGQRSRREWR